MVIDRRRETILWLDSLGGTSQGSSAKKAVSLIYFKSSTLYMYIVYPPYLKSFTVCTLSPVYEWISIFVETKAMFSRYKIFCFLYSNFSKTRKTRLVTRIRRKQF